MPQVDGTLRALETHIFDETMRGTAEGYRPWDLLPKSTMTNAVVQEIVGAVDGHTVMLKYNDGQKVVLIPTGTTIVTYLPGSVDELRPGAAVFVPGAAKLPDGTLQAQRGSSSIILPPLATPASWRALTFSGYRKRSRWCRRWRASTYCRRSAW